MITKVDNLKQYLPQVLFNFSEQFNKQGKKIFLVGGVVRDLLINPKSAKSGDFDFATDARPNEVQRLFRKTIPTGIKHGTVTVLFEKESFEVTTFRSDGDYSDGRHPDSVQFSDSIEEDLERRDFTINALALDLQSMELYDLFNSVEDIKRKTVRAVGDAETRFREDGLRPLRACRFAGKLGFEIDYATFEAISKTLDVFKAVSIERIADELKKIMKSKTPSIALEQMRKSGLLEIVLPELLLGYGVEQNEFHKYDIYYHNIYSCDWAPADKINIRFAALLHDIGKVRSLENYRRRTGEEDGVAFYNHEMIGARMADRIMKRLKFSNIDRKNIYNLIKNHMFHYTDEWTDGAVRRLLRKVGVGNIPDLFDLRKADRMGNGKKKGPSPSLKKLQKRIDAIIAADNAITVRDLDINGNDLIKKFSLTPGRIIGQTLNQLLEVILDEPEKNSSEILLELAEEILIKEGIIDK